MRKSPVLRTSSFGIIVVILLASLGQAVRPQSTVQFSPQSAAQLLKEGTYYHGLDDTTDRAADRYRQLLLKFPKSSQAEQAQFYLGTYYQKKFFILESRNKVQDWTSFNQAEEALNGYIKKYRSGKGFRTYLADAYYNLAIISLRRGYIEKAKQLLQQMKTDAAKDRTVYIYKIVWSARTDDVIKANCGTSQLATATIDSIGDDNNFGRMLGRIRDWCWKNCKAGA